MAEYTVKQFAAKEGVNERTVRNWIDKRAVQVRRTPGGGIRIVELAPGDSVAPRSRSLGGEGRLANVTMVAAETVRLDKRQCDALDDALTPHHATETIRRELERALMLYTINRQRHPLPALARKYIDDCAAGARACIAIVERPPHGLVYNEDIVASLRKFIIECEQDVTSHLRARHRPADTSVEALGRDVLSALSSAGIQVSLPAPGQRSPVTEVLRLVRQWAARLEQKSPPSKARSYAFASQAIKEHSRRTDRRELQLVRSRGTAHK